ncbi:MAG: hypothetical protein GY710_11360 [Desulfobacteraceae bacterium]|nr:hypothetical protein [Desulfobacteraceae bacterium]
MRKHLSFFLIVVMPVMITALYLFLFSVEKFSSSATYLIKDNSTSKNMGIDLGIFGSTSSSNKQDSKIIETYFHSFDTLDRVDKKFGLYNLYRSSDTDLLNRLFRFSTREDFLKAFVNNLTISFDEATGLSTLSFMGTNPEQARKIVKFLLSCGEGALNQFNRTNAEKKLSFINDQVNLNKQKLELATAKLEKFQNQYNIIDPKADLAINNSIIANLSSVYIEKNAQRNQLLSYMHKESIDVVKLDYEIREIKSALKKIKSKMTGDTSTHLNDLFFKFARLQAQVDFTSQVYKKTLVEYEVSRIEALQEAKIFEMITTPTLPDESSWPNKPKVLGSMIILLLVLYKITGLIGLVINDHKD